MLGSVVALHLAGSPPSKRRLTRARFPSCSLDAFLHFARTYGERAAEMVEESVGGGEHWCVVDRPRSSSLTSKSRRQLDLLDTHRYPLALASIHVTAFVLDMAKKVRSSVFPSPPRPLPDLSRPRPQRDLQLHLLRTLPSPSIDTDAPSPSSSPSTSPSTALEPLLSLSSSLLILFHAFWLSHQPRPTVMQFESVFRDFEARMRPWIRRGVADGRALGWRDDDEGTLKLE